MLQVKKNYIVARKALEMAREAHRNEMKQHHHLMKDLESPDDPRLEQYTDLEFESRGRHNMRELENAAEYAQRELFKWAEQRIKTDPDPMVQARLSQFDFGPTWDIFTGRRKPKISELFLMVDIDKFADVVLKLEDKPRQPTVV